MNILSYFLDLLYPRRCAFCHRLLDGDAKVCPACRKKLPYTLGDAQRIKLAGTGGIYAALYYEGDVRNSLLRYKFHGLNAYASVYGDFLSKCIDENGISCDIITWVPLSKRRLRRRGYDQARLLGEELAKRQGLVCLALLRKVRNTPAQSRTGNAMRRKANIAGAYAALNESAVSGKRVLLVDDIVTTGATLAECAKTLKAAGAAEVIGLAVARKRD